MSKYVFAQGRLLLPRTARNELWPAILTKGILKLLSVNLGPNENVSESALNTAIVHMLTGWLPESIPWFRMLNGIPKARNASYLILNRNKKANKADQRPTDGPTQRLIESRARD